MSEHLLTGLLRPLAGSVGLITCLAISHPSLLATNAPGGAQRLQLAISPAVQYSPGTIQLTAKVSPNVDNRVLCLAIDGDTGFYRSSCITLNAEQAPITHQLRYRGLPEGQYEASAELRDNSQVLAQVSHPFQVL